ncbi:lipid A deacylase LpxR family protein [Arenimonas caeni]|jgi:hypothetical protein|uniref:lipid A deacylase LpxR family protein n=1 Tax=Arenimonas caeni TaxID=2058085 RepID=UPI002A35F810|nr:lipid A deacylase LpxR family protein [Arenimonas caeni]MDY0021575.1 lipid A deacylase LpxR family protein [Arenimonas caeni]
MTRHALLAATLLAIAPLAQASCGDDGRVLLRSDNDVYGQAGQDENYSAGAYAAWISPTLESDPGCLPAGIAWLDRATGWLRWGRGDQRNLVLDFHHALYTPRDGLRADIDPDDRPYASTMLLGLAQQVRDGDRLAVTRLQLGMVGPSAQGELAHAALPHLYGRERFTGWDNQVGDLPLVQFSHDRLWRRAAANGWFGLESDRIHYLGATAGNARIQGHGGVEWRLGRGLPDDFGSNPMHAGADGSAPGTRAPVAAWQWHVFASLEGRGIARDITLDGHGGSHSVDRRDFVAEAGLGVVLTHGRWRLAYGHYRRSREFAGQPEAPVYGSFTLGYRF